MVVRVLEVTSLIYVKRKSREKYETLPKLYGNVPTPQKSISNRCAEVL